MTSIFQRALGRDFDRLHPQLQRRFGVGLHNGTACTGRGTMHQIWHGGSFVRPFLRLGGTRNILLPQRGSEVPFVIENVPYLDAYGREAVSFVRTFAFPAGRPRRFDATMVLSEERGCIVDYLGTHQHLATDLSLSVDAAGALHIRSGSHRFREGPVDVRVPDLVAGDAHVRESYDDAAGCFRIQVRVVNRRFGPLFGYEGSFQAEFAPASGTLPSALRPVREEART